MNSLFRFKNFAVRMAIAAVFNTWLFSNAAHAQALPAVTAVPAAQTAPASPGAAAKLSSRPISAAPRPRTTPVVFAPEVSSPTADIELVLGEIRMLPVKGKVRRIAVGNGSNLSATTVDQSLLLIGEQVGGTTLMVWTELETRSYRVRVVAADLVSTRRLISGMLQGVKGVTVSENDSKLYLSGVAEPALLQRLTALLKDSPSVVFDLQSDIPRQVTRSVLFRLHFVEVKKSLLENIGIQWSKGMSGPTFAAQGIAANTGIFAEIPPSTGGQNLLDPTVSNFVSRGGAQNGVFFGLASAITSRINLGVTDGDARVLASPELTAKSGGKARLQVGGEVPIPIAGAFGSTTVEFKPYGIILSIEPTIDGNDVITAKLSTELSQIDPAVTVAGIPGFLTRSTATEISVRPGEMVALSGLINNELSNAIDKVPGLGSIPILGRLFRSDAYRNNKTDLVVLLEPEIIVAGEGLAAQLRERGERNTGEFKSKAAPAPALKPITSPIPVPTPRDDSAIR
jgi:pilus assembly protein CpaC